jgi:cbb3-type cytochrome oxidase subunit 3
VVLLLGLVLVLLGYLWSALREEAREVLQTLARLSEREGVDE